MLNKFKFQIVPVYSKRGSYFQSKIWIDDEVFFDDTVVHLGRLVESMYQSGRYFLMTCSCGEAGCAGFFHEIRVKTKQDTVVWLMPNFGLYRKHRLAKIVLSREQMYAEITRELKRIYPFLKTKWYCEVHDYEQPTRYYFLSSFPLDSGLLSVTRFNQMYTKLLESPIR
jgi:hypothetical protein